MVDAGTLLRYARRRAGISQRSLAEQAGVGRASVERVEAGRSAQFDTVAHLLEVCGLELIATAVTAAGPPPEIRLDPRIRPVERLFPAHRRRMEPRPTFMRVLDHLAGSQAVVVGRAAAVLLGAAIPWYHIDVCPGPNDALPDGDLPGYDLVVPHPAPGGLDHGHLRRAARYVDPANLPLPHLAAIFVADPVDLLIMARHGGDPELVAAALALIVAERHRPVRDEGDRRYPAHSQAREGDRLDPFSANWQPVRRKKRRRAQGA